MTPTESLCAAMLESLCTHTPQPTPAPLYSQMASPARHIPPDAMPQAPVLLDDELPQAGPHQHGPWVLRRIGGVVCDGCLLPLAVIAQQRKREGRG